MIIGSAPPGCKVTHPQKRCFSAPDTLFEVAVRQHKARTGHVPTAMFPMRLLGSADKGPFPERISCRVYSASPLLLLKEVMSFPTSLCMKNRRCALRVCVPENKSLETQNLVYFHCCLSLVTRKISCNSVAVKAATNVAESAPYCF